LKPQEAKVVKTKSSRACPVCGTPFTGELCPVCVLRGALGNEETVSQSVGPTLSPSELRFEHYEVLTRDDGAPLELGRGAMGVTYKALDVNLRYAVALKVINARFIGDESARRRFVREARAAASLRHPNVASVFHLGKSGDNYFYAMEFVDGESLDKVIRRSGQLEPSTALRVVTLVAAGLEAIDQQNLVHRDIKPSNIMVSMHGDNVANAKIIDLGLAKGTVADDGSISEISIQGAFAGTPSYASPEQFSGVGADIRSDLYSLGITLWEMLAGEVPFKGSTSRLIYQHQHATPPIDKLIHVPQPVVALLEVLLEKDPSQRLQTPTELVEAIPKVTEAVDSGKRVTTDQLRSVADRIAVRPKQSTRRLHRALTGTRIRTLGWMLASVLGIAGLLLAWYFFSGHEGFFFNQRVAGAIPTEKSIAVLPFENISANKDDAYFADGVQDEILNNLAKIAQLKVISRTSVMQYRADSKRDLRQIAGALGVANVLEGTVRRDGNHVRVSIDLVDAGNDNTIWADSYDRELIDIFAIQSEVARTIARKLMAALSPQEKGNIEARPTENLEAYDLYLRAKQLIQGNFALSSGAFEKELQEAIDLLDQAVRLDPKFALAYCQAAHAHDWLYRLTDPTLTRLGLGDAAVKTALRLQPDLPEAHLAYAYHLEVGYRDFERAQVQLAIARREMPNNTEAMMLEAYIERRRGNVEKAIQGFEEAISLDPRNPDPVIALAETLDGTRQYAAAERAYDRAIELAPNNPILKLSKADSGMAKTGDINSFRAAVAAPPTWVDPEVLETRLKIALIDRDFRQATQLIEKMKGSSELAGFAYAKPTARIPIDCYLILIARLQAGALGTNSTFAEAREQLNKQVQMSQGDQTANLLSQLAVVDALLGKREMAIAEAKRAVEMRPTSIDAIDGAALRLNLVVVYAWSNDLDLAFETLAPLIRTPFGVNYGDLKLSPYWDPLRKDPRFDKLLAELAPKD
jgi:serine/threonine protein kinase/cytochrome c-type biogenesis protein CcmH/NrfG